jgi:exonuclease SbcC
VNELEQQAQQSAQQLETEQHSLHSALAALALTAPAEDKAAAWLAQREAEANSWQEHQTQLGALQERIHALMPLLDTLPPSEHEDAGDTVPENWRAIHTECISLQGQLSTLQAQEKLDAERLTELQAQFATALAASCFSDRQAFLAAALDDESVNKLEQLKRTLEQQIQQSHALAAQAEQQCKEHVARRPADLPQDFALQAMQEQLHQIALKLRENTTRQGEIRQQLKQDSDNRLHQQALMQQIEEATRLADDWGYLNALIGSKEGDRFRKFAQGLTLDNSRNQQNAPE